MNWEKDERRTGEWDLVGPVDVVDSVGPGISFLNVRSGICVRKVSNRYSKPSKYRE